MRDWMDKQEELKCKVLQLDKKSYSLYKSLKGVYQFPGFQLSIDLVQGDPFATPSRVRVLVDNKYAKIPKEYWDSKEKEIALEDYLLWNFHRNLASYSNKRMGSGHSGNLTICRCGQEVLERIAILQKETYIEVRLEVGFPARGRSILAKEFINIFFEELPILIKKSFIYNNLDGLELKKSIELAVDQSYLRKQIKKQELVSFIADGSILPRESGVSQKPLKGAVPFSSPENLAVEFSLPSGKKLRGMGIRRGITIIVGGGYHGKSTLLKSIEQGVYNHRLGDGREYVITEQDGIKIRAEDGRCIHGSDISLFINQLPNKKETKKFYTDNASGSTSQAANIIEGIETGTKLFLIDEDTSATNFMIRDQWMSQLVEEEKEPITPFIQRARQLYQKEGVSTIVVVGSSGAYLSVADTIIQMDVYQARDVTEKGKEVIRESGYLLKEKENYSKICFKRIIRNPKRSSIGKEDKIKIHGTDEIIIGKEVIGLRYMEQIVDTGQVAGMGYLLKYAIAHLINGERTIQEITDIIYNKINKEGLISIIPIGYHAGAPVMPRRQEFMGMVSRYRSLQIS